MSSLPSANQPLPHFVSDAPFDVHSVLQLSPEQQRVALASQWRLMWLKFRRHRLALASAFVLAIIYVIALTCEFFAPYPGIQRNTDFIHAPPQAVHLFHDGRLVGPFVYPFRLELDMGTLHRNYVVDRSSPQPLGFFCRSYTYSVLGLFEADRHLVCPPENGTLFVAGTDRLGRDIFSRILEGGRISLTIGLLGVAVSFILGIVIGGFAGYFGGRVDMIVQRTIEVIQSLPHIPLWMALASIIPVSWSPLVVYFGITIILGLLDWTGLARAVRSKLLSLREEDYVVAAQLMGARATRIIGRHLIPGFFSHLIAKATVAIPGMILGETALSFLGLGIRPPTISWGVMLNDAQNIQVVALYPWLMLPAVPVIVVILAFNFFGDGLRDAADPYR